MRLKITGPPAEREWCLREIGGEEVAIDFARIAKSRYLKMRPRSS